VVRFAVRRYQDRRQVAGAGVAHATGVQVDLGVGQRGRAGRVEPLDEPVEVLEQRGRADLDKNICYILLLKLNKKKLF